MDPVRFTGKEVLEMAVKIEENGLGFYEDAGKASKSKKIKELFKTLASEEAEHKKVFLDLIRLLPPEEASTGLDSYSEEAALYLRAIADTEVFTSPDKGKELAKKIKNEADALDYAIDMEKDSILFYYELARLVRDKDKRVLDSLIEQEKSHLRKLSELRKAF